MHPSRAILMVALALLWGASARAQARFELLPEGGLQLHLAQNYPPPGYYAPPPQPYAPPPQPYGQPGQMSPLAQQKYDSGEKLHRAGTGLLIAGAIALPLGVILIIAGEVLIVNCVVTDSFGNSGNATF